MDVEDLLPPLPGGNWGRDDSEDEHWFSYEFCCDQRSLEDAKDYADALEAAGFGRNVVRDRTVGTSPLRAMALGNN